MNTTEEQPTENFVAFEQAAPYSPASPVMKDVLPTAINPDQPHWNALAAFGIFVLSVLLMLILGVVSLGAYAAVKYSTTRQIDFANDPMAIVVNLFSIIPAHLLTLLAVWALVTRGGRQPFWQTLGWHWTPRFGFWVSVLTTISLFALAIGILSIFPEQENSMIRLLKSSRMAVFAAAFMATFTAPLVEETVYRGVMYPAFRSWLGTTGAVAAVTLLFAIVHVPQYLPSYGTILVILLLSLILTLIRAWTKSLLPCFVIHTIFNGVQAILLVLEPYIPKSQAPIEKSAAAIFYFFNL